ncbi:MAG: hypothetical protein HC826_01130 [Rhodospirillales bacterium]|nr:hypothetical protein [Rhodospirillales bacterium]
MGDGKISEEEFRRGHAQMFDTLDSNTDGNLSRDEWRSSSSPSARGVSIRSSSGWTQTVTQ